jgi:aspartate/methionine/tyrosine aminotransferase
MIAGERVVVTVSRLKDLPGIGVDAAGNRADAAADPAILRMENLDTDLRPPAAALTATRAAIDDDAANSYLPFTGHTALRDAAAAHVSRLSGVAYDSTSQCVITPGGLGGILNVLLATLEPGDEVVITDPAYAGLLNRIRLAGGVPRFVPLRPDSTGWRLDIEALSKAASPRTKVVLLMSPSMPTGAVHNAAEWEAIADFVHDTGAWLVWDAAMERILFDGTTYVHPASLPGLVERTVTVGSLSKEYRMIGWRIGWVVGPKSLISDVAAVGMANVVCQVGIAQSAGVAALTAPDDGVAEAVAVWERRRNVLLAQLEGLPVVRPSGGWSMLLNTAALGFSPQEAADMLFRDARIAATPMTGWGPSADSYLRFVFANESEERLVGFGDKVRNGLGVRA